MTQLVITLGVGACSSRAASPPVLAEPPPATYEERVTAAESLNDNGSWERALRLADALTVEAPQRPGAHLARGRALALGDRLEDSAQAYERAHGLGERSPRLYTELTSVYDVLKRYDASERMYREYLDDHPDDGEMRQQLALTLMLRGRPDAASAELERLHDGTLSSPQRLSVAEDLVLAWSRAGRYAEAETLARQVVAQDPKRSTALRVLAELAVRRGALTEGRGYAEQAVSVAPGDATARRLRAQLRLALGDATGALEDYGALFRAGLDDGGVLMGLSGALLLTGDLAKADEALARARTLGIDHPTLALREAQLRRRRGDRKALGDIEDFAKSHPTSIDAWQELLAAGGELRNTAMQKRAQAALEKLGVTRGR